MGNNNYNPKRANTEELSIYQEGFWVHHTYFGTGVIVSQEEQYVLVQFDAGVKKFFLNSDKLSPLNLNGVFCYKGLRYRKLPDLDELELVGADNPLAAKADIPALLHINGQDFPVTAIGKMAFANMKRLRDVFIPAGVVEIAPLAFAGSDYIRQIKNESCGRENASYVMNDLGLWGILPNLERKVPFILCQFEDIRFYAGYMVEKQRIPTFYFLVRQNGLWGIINKTGHQQAPCIYDALSPKEEGRLCIGFEYRKGGRTGLINAKGEEVINP